jgi:hypothetical protein
MRQRDASDLVDQGIYIVLSSPSPALRAHRDITTDNSNICDWGHGGGESAAPVWPHSDGSSGLL